MQASVARTQVHPLPEIAVAVRPAGSEFTTPDRADRTRLAHVGHGDDVCRAGLALHEADAVGEGDGEIRKRVAKQHVNLAGVFGGNSEVRSSIAVEIRDRDSDRNLCDRHP